MPARKPAAALPAFYTEAEVAEDEINAAISDTERTETNRRFYEVRGGDPQGDSLWTIRQAEAITGYSWRHLKRLGLTVARYVGPRRVGMVYARDLVRVINGELKL